MKKSLASLFLVATANILLAIPAIASSGSSTFYAPSHDEDGGCREAGYNEYDNVFFYDWTIPALADGESVTVTPTLYWQNPGTQSPPPSGAGYEYTFTCNNGTLSSPGAGAPWGTWI